MAHAVLGLSKDPFHEPFHARGLYVRPPCHCAYRHQTALQHAPMSRPGRRRQAGYQATATRAEPADMWLPAGSASAAHHRSLAP